MSDHYLIADGKPVYDEHGKSQARTSRFYPGRAKCSCGALSDAGISQAAGRQWFGTHKVAS